MERQLGLRVGQQPIDSWEKEVAAADHPQIRHFGVAQEKSLTPLSTVKGQWNVCTPEAVKDFTAVGYFFGRDLQKARHVPVGIIHASWGGTPAEAWTSEAGLRRLPDFADTAGAAEDADRRSRRPLGDSTKRGSRPGSSPTTPARWRGSRGAIRRWTRAAGRR